MKKMSKYFVFVGLVMCFSAMLVGVMKYLGIVELDSTEILNVYALYYSGGVALLTPFVYNIIESFKRN
ncbi:putative uncharacterised protein [Salmonella phage Vi01]|uniref:Uncharacterized protein n=7 Tax=Kuttervirus TaxID=2169536 RepID=E1XTK4_BPSAV|nr:putative uncharacterised protein [Salmonella phage Vi01]YP_008770842.1 hypothetical protein Maynard_15 [Salmonella phage Maynard]YP_008771633.1 hypothetical protein Marshall_15 [Salmonella phage Marshall]YP_009101490.1 hypothetical protein PI33_gp094 [Escherichia phage ECML-4]YP_009617778.1 hypothetical protein FDI91_gp153 [Salmonella phage STML-13-1]AGF88476.1 hypothetical protein SP063_00115 [Salmonella phage FSL SP-063]AGF89176.1 hypothetical protein SP029_00982 [Salmonella phage FSL SP